MSLTEKLERVVLLGQTACSLGNWVEKYAYQVADIGKALPLSLSQLPKRLHTTMTQTQHARFNTFAQWLARTSLSLQMATSVNKNRGGLRLHTAPVRHTSQRP